MEEIGGREVSGYWGLNELTVELEEPFGDDANDLPIIVAQRCFVRLMCEQFVSDINTHVHRLNKSIVRS